MQYEADHLPKILNAHTESALVEHVNSMKEACTLEKQVLKDEHVVSLKEEYNKGMLFYYKKNEKMTIFED